MRKTRRFALKALALAAGTAFVTPVLAQAFYAAKPVQRPAAEFKFDTIPPMLKLSDAYGNRSAGPHGTFGMIPAKAALFTCDGPADFARAEPRA